MVLHTRHGCSINEKGNGPSHSSWLLLNIKRKKARGKRGQSKLLVAHQKAVDGADSTFSRLALHNFGKKNLDRVTHQPGSGNYDALCRAVFDNVEKVFTKQHSHHWRRQGSRPTENTAPAFRVSIDASCSRILFGRTDKVPPRALPTLPLGPELSKGTTDMPKKKVVAVRLPHSLPPADFRQVKGFNCKRSVIGE